MTSSRTRRSFRAKWLIQAPSVATVAASVTLAPTVVRAETLGAHVSDVVNTLRGSNSAREYSRGNTFPAVAVPFGFNLWTPVTEGNSDRWLYKYRSATLQGFAVSHEPSPWIGEHGSFQIMPMLGSVRSSPEARAAKFSHKNEIARPYYYRVQFDDTDIKTEMTPTNRACVFRFTFDSKSQAFLLFDSIDSVSGSVSVNPTNRSVQGYVDQNGPRLYFFGRLDTDIVSSGSNQGPGANAWLELDNRAQKPVTLSIATSFIGVEQAAVNLGTEVGTKTFDEVRDDAQAIWDRQLSAIELSGASTEARTLFYSNLYRVFLYPNAAFEKVGNNYRYFSPYSSQLRDGKVYVNNGFWDTYRAVWPLFSLLVPTQAGEMLQGFVTAFEDGGWVPRWSGPGYVDCMVGSSSDIAFADSYLRGVRNFDIHSAYQSMLRNALTVSREGAKGRKHNERSIFLGYVPVEAGRESASWTLEDAINDYGIARIARTLQDDANAEYFENRAMRYSLLFSRSVGFFRGRHGDGSWRTPDSQFNADEWGYEFVEGSAWHYLIAPTTDFQGLANLFGGRARLAAKIGTVLNAARGYRVGSYGEVIHEMREAYDTNMGQYAHANEPVHSMLYAFDYAGQPHRTQAAVREVLNRLYDTGIGTGNGYLGDEDNGQMSAWYVFSALGFYPASPGHPEYALGSPLFERATIHLENGNSFQIVAHRTSRRNRYIQSARLNGKKYDKPYLPHAALVGGGILELEMGETPSTWGSASANLPHSITAVNNTKAPAFRVDRATGGTPSVIHGPRTAEAEGVEAFDDNSLTTWRASDPEPTIQYRFASGKKYAVRLYTITSSSDEPGHDPKAWVLQGSLDCTNWANLDSRTDQTFTWRNQTRAFLSNNDTPFGCYRLTVTQNHGSPTTHLAEIELIE